jgi:hypothetical protein
MTSAAYSGFHAAPFMGSCETPSVKAPVRASCRWTRFLLFGDAARLDQMTPSAARSAICCLVIPRISPNTYSLSSP